MLIRSMRSRIISAELYPLVDPSTSKRVEEGWSLGRHGSHLFRNDATGLCKLGFKLQCSITRVTESLFLLTFLQLHHTLLKKRGNSCTLSNTNCLQMAEDVLALQMPSDHAVCVYSYSFYHILKSLFLCKQNRRNEVKLASNTLIEAIFARRLCSIWSLAM